MPQCVALGPGADQARLLGRCQCVGRQAGGPQCPVHQRSCRAAAQGDVQQCLVSGRGQPCHRPPPGPFHPRARDFPFLVRLLAAEGPGARQAVRVFQEDQWVAAAQTEQAVDGRGGGVQVATAQQFATGLFAECRDGEVVHALPANGGVVFRTSGHHEGQPFGGQASCDEEQYTPRIGIGPVQIVHEHHQRLPFACGRQHPQRPGTHRVGPGAGGFGQRETLLERPALGAGHVGEALAQRQQDVREDGVRQDGLRLHSARPHHPHPGPPGDVVEQRALPDAGVTAQQHRPTPLGQPVHHAVQYPARLLAPDRRRTVPYRRLVHAAPRAPHQRRGPHRLTRVPAPEGPTQRLGFALRIADDFSYVVGA